MTLLDWTPIIIAVLSLIGVIYSVYRQTRKDKDDKEKQKADIAEQVGEAWAKLVDPLEKRVATLEKENELLRRRERVLWDYIEELRAQLTSNNIKVPDLPTLPKMNDTLR